MQEKTQELLAKELEKKKTEVLAALRKMGAGSAIVEYSGSGDSLEEEAASVFKLPFLDDGLGHPGWKAHRESEMAMEDGALDRPKVSWVEEYGEWNKEKGWETQEHEVSLTIPEALVSLCNTWWEFAGVDGFWNNDGGQGEMRVDVKTGIFKLHHENNEMSHDEAEYEL